MHLPTTVADLVQSASCAKLSGPRCHLELYVQAWLWRVCQVHDRSHTLQHQDWRVFLAWFEHSLDWQSSEWTHVFDLNDKQKQNGQLPADLLNWICYDVIMAGFEEIRDLMEFEVQQCLMCAVQQWDMELHLDLLKLPWMKTTQELIASCEVLYAVWNATACVMVW